MDSLIPNDSDTFGAYVRTRREALGKSLRGMAAEIKVTPVYLSDIEKGNRYAPEKHLDEMIKALRINSDEVDFFYDLAGKSRNNNYPDLATYIGETQLARVALRRARDLEIPNSQWQEFIDQMQKDEKT